MTRPRSSIAAQSCRRFVAILRRRPDRHPLRVGCPSPGPRRVIFIDLRDHSGVAQVVFRDADVLTSAHRLRAEFCVAVEGAVEIRPEGNANPDIATGRSRSTRPR